MDDAKTQFESLRKWIVEHKLRSVGYLWLSGVAGSIAYNWSRPNMKTSLKRIHDARYIPGGKIIYDRVHPEFITLVALAGAAAVEYYDYKKFRALNIVHP